MSDVSELVAIGQTRYGNGVFARRGFAAGDVIGEIEGVVIDDPDYSSRYAMDLGGSLTLEPAAPFRFLNHSCDPNCELFQWYDEDGDGSEEDDEDWSRRMWISAIRDIQPGEEMTIDYGWPADVAIPCLCNAPNCRGWIVDPAELPLVQSRNLPTEIAS